APCALMLSDAAFNWPDFRGLPSPKERHLRRMRRNVSVWGGMRRNMWAVAPDGPGTPGRRWSHAHIHPTFTPADPRLHGDVARRRLSRRTRPPALRRAGHGRVLQHLGLH